MSEQTTLPGVDTPAVSLGEQIKEMVAAVRARISDLEAALASARKELVDAKKALTPQRKVRRAKKEKAAKGGRKKGSKSKPKVAAVEAVA